MTIQTWDHRDSRLPETVCVCVGRHLQAAVALLDATKEAAQKAYRLADGDPSDLCETLALLQTTTAMQLRMREEVRAAWRAYSELPTPSTTTTPARPQPR